MIKSCCPYGCTNRLSAKNKGLAFHRLPSDPKLLKKWLKVMRTESVRVNSNTKVCGAHFPGGRRSRPDELPSIFPCTKKNKRKPPAVRHLAQHPDPPATNIQASVEDKDFEVLDITGYVYSERPSKNNLLTPPGQTGERGDID